MAAAKQKRMTKAQIMSELSDKSGLNKRDVAKLMDALKELISRELGRRGPKEFVIPDLVKLKVKEVPAQKNKKFRNPGTGEVFTKDVPKSKKLRVTALKRLKVMAGTAEDTSAS